MRDPAAGVFETLLVRDGRVQALERHLERLRASVAELYGTTLPAELAARARERAAPLAAPHRLRIDAVPGGEPPDIEIELTATALEPGRPDRYACAPRPLPGGQGPHKLRDREALGERSGAPVPLLVDADGTVLEAAWANVWLLRDRTLVTPPLDGRILPGVTRARLLELAPALGFAVREQPITLEDVRAASVLLLTSSLALAATAALDAVPLAADPTVRTLREALLAADWF